MIEKVMLITPRGFCAGVERAVDVVDEALRIIGPPIYVKHEIVHNKQVCDILRSKGAIFIEDLRDIPEGNTCIFSAHGVAPSVREEAKARKLSVIDATCPLVTKIHLEVGRYAKEGYEIIYIGHKNHPEAVGVMGIRPDITTLVENAEEVKALTPKDPSKLVYLTQTTLSVDECKEVIGALRSRFSSISSPPRDDICYATTNRQSAIKFAAKKCNIIIVVGSKNSSNSNRLVETAKRSGVESYLVDKLSEIDQKWFEGKKVLGLSAGASSPEYLVEEIASYYKNKGAVVEELKLLDEHMKFTMPHELLALRGPEEGLSRFSKSFESPTL